MKVHGTLKADCRKARAAREGSHLALDRSATFRLCPQEGMVRPAAETVSQG